MEVGKETQRPLIFMMRSNQSCADTAPRNSRRFPKCVQTMSHSEYLLLSAWTNCDWEIRDLVPVFVSFLFILILRLQIVIGSGNSAGISLSADSMTPRRRRVAALPPR